MTAAEQQALGVVDLVVDEPGEGAHTDHAETARRSKAVDRRASSTRSSRSRSTTLVEARYQRYRPLGRVHGARSAARSSAGAPGSRRPAAEPARPGASLAGATAPGARRAAGSGRGLTMSADRARDRRARTPRTRRARAADHAAIDRLADELVPALVAKLAATGLGEIEVARDLEGPGPPARRERPRSSADDGPAVATQPGHAGHGHAPASLEGTARHASRGPARIRPTVAAAPRPRARTAARMPADRRTSRGPVGRRDLAGRRRLPAPRRGDARARASAPATGSASSTCSASRRTSSRPPTASSARPSSRPARASSTARSSSSIELADRAPTR